MTDGNGSVAPQPGEETTKEEAAVETPNTVKIAGGEEIKLEPHHLAILVILDPVSGTPAIFNIQNCPLRAYSRMLLNEALGLYNMSSIGNYTSALLEQRIMASLKKGDKKGGIIDPFKSGK